MTPAPHPDLKVEWIEKKGYVISLCQFCTKISPKSDTHPLPCPWLMYTTIESVVVVCAHFKMLDCMLNTSASSDVLDILDEWLNGDDHLTLFKWEVREKIRELRQQTKEQMMRTKER